MSSMTRKRHDSVSSRAFASSNSSSSSDNSRVVVFVRWSSRMQGVVDRTTSCVCHCCDETGGVPDGAPPDVWSVMNVWDVTSVAPWNESHGITRCPDGLVSRGNNCVPGDHSILYPFCPGNAMHRFPFRSIRTASFSVIESRPKIAGRLLPHPSATLARYDMICGLEEFSYLTETGTSET